MRIIASVVQVLHRYIKLFAYRFQSCLLVNRDTLQCAVHFGCIDNVYTAIWYHVWEVVVDGFKSYTDVLPQAPI